METINPIDNPVLAAALAEKAMSEGVQETFVANKVTAPPSGEVELVAGHYNPFTGELTTTAQVRELNGADEEAIAKITNAGNALMLIVSRAVVSLGNEPVKAEMLDELLAADRDYLLLNIRKLTFGNEVSVITECYSCNTPDLVFEIDLDKDVQIKKLTDPIVDREFVVECKVGNVEVVLPNGKTQKKLVQNFAKNAAELDSIILRECVQSINGTPVISDAQILNLSVLDRRTILSTLFEKNPGPDLSNIKKDCPSCNKEVTLSLSLADLFR